MIDVHYYAHAIVFSGATLAPALRQAYTCATEAEEAARSLAAKAAAVVVYMVTQPDGSAAEAEVEVLSVLSGRLGEADAEASVATEKPVGEFLKVLSVV